MEEIFIKSIHIDDIRNIQNFDIPLDENQMRHLIITGKNGSGKTTLLRELGGFLGKREGIADRETVKNELLRLKGISDLSLVERSKVEIANQIASYILYLGGIDINFNEPYSVIDNQYLKGQYITAFFEAKRDSSLTIPKGINKVELKPVYKISDKAGKEFIQYIVNLKADRSFARDEHDAQSVKQIDQWFENFEKNILSLFGSEQAALVFDRKTYNFDIKETNKQPYNLNQLSDGYSAILSIVTELIMRMEANKSKSYDVQGVVLVDEIETHLHVDLQKKILPFLTAFFPKIQFIVTTHSPFVLNSVQNAVICDLEKRIVTTDLSGYSYDAIIESYFDSDKYSTVLKEKVALFELLSDKVIRTEVEDNELTELRSYLDSIPKFLSNELAVKLQQIKLKHLKRKSNGV